MFNTIKGWFGEKLTTFGMWALLDRTIYHRIDDLIVPSANGTTQIDHVLVSIFGIFVIETKNMKGWIFGGHDRDKWTQVIYGKKSQFQNPIRQNYRHVRCLSGHLKLELTFFRPVVFFIGECEFKTDMPANVMSHGLIPYIRQFNTPCLLQQQVLAVVSKLNSLKEDRSLTKTAHLDSLRERHSSTTICPRCNGQLVQRTSKSGSFAGKPFLGCSNYPRCRYIKNI